MRAQAKSAEAGWSKKVFTQEHMPRSKSAEPAQLKLVERERKLGACSFNARAGWPK